MKHRALILAFVVALAFSASAFAQYPRTFTTPVWFHINAR